MSEPVTVVVTNRVHDDVLDRLRKKAVVIANTGPEPWPADELRGHLAQADSLIAFMPDRVDGAFLDNAPNLHLIACALKGYDNSSVPPCSARGVLS